MYRVTVTDAGGAFATYLEHAIEGYRNLVPLGNEIAQLMHDGMREALFAGIDRHAQSFAPLAESTMKKREREGIYGATPFLTRGDDSTIVRAFDVIVEAPEAWMVVVTGGWPGVPWIGYHVDRAPRTKIPLRDFWGMTEEYDALIHAAADRYIAALAAGSA